MTAPVFFADDLNSGLSTIAEGDHVHLGGAEGKHAATVRRMQVGEELDLVNGEGGRARCRVRAVNGQELDLVVEHVMCEPASDPHLILVQALAKGGRDEQAIETSTEIGIDSVIPWQAHRSIVRWTGSKAERARSKWISIVRAAAKQSRRAWIPQVLESMDSRALARWTQDRCSHGDVVFMCHEQATVSILEAMSQLGLTVAGSAFPRKDGTAKAVGASPRSIAIIVGPEGGIDDDEYATLTEAGAIPVLLGPTVLRSSTAGPVATTLIRALTTWRHEAPTDRQDAHVAGPPIR